MDHKPSLTVRLVQRFPWLPNAMSYCAIGVLAVSAIENAATDHGILMAINCFCLGIVFWGLLMGKSLQRSLREMNEIRERMNDNAKGMEAVAKAFQHAVDTGQIEVMRILDISNHKPPTHH